MGEANEGGGGSKRGGGGGAKSFQPWKLGSVTSYPKDLLHKLMSTTSGTNLGFVKREDEEGEGEGDLELNLGLSLGGRFGIDKNSNSKKLMRSSSIATTLPVFRDKDGAIPTSGGSAPAYPTIVRTSSLPAETEEEWRKRKELQTLRRLEAKRRRSEKQKGSGVNASNANSNSNVNPSNNLSCLEDGRSEVEEGKGGDRNLGDRQYMISALANYKSGSWIGQPFGLPNWAKQGDVVAKGKTNVNGGGNGGGLMRANSGFGQQRDSQGSVESQGGSSSGLSEFESKSLQGNNSAGEAKSSGSNHSIQERSNQDGLNPSQPASGKNSCRTAPGSAENPSKRPDSRNKGKEVGTNGMGDMPCVFTTGDGPTGRRIDGILYKYGKGEEVRIMCVCHGIFLSPAEFVKHAGGTDVDHPLRHIVVNTSAISFS